MIRDEIHLAFNNNLPVKIIGIKGWITEISISTWHTTSSNSMETLNVTIELENLTTIKLAEKDFEIVALWKEKEVEMQNKNDKIVELIKAYLDGKTLQPTAYQPNGCYSGMDGSLKSLITTVIAHPDSFKIKPETRTVLLRHYQAKDVEISTWTSDSFWSEEELQKQKFFKHWLDDKPLQYEVEV